MFARYLPSKCRLTLKLWTRVTQGHQKWHHLVARVWFPIRLLQQLRPCLAPFPRYANLLVKNHPIFSPPSCIRHLIRGEAVGVKQQPSVKKTRMMRLSGGKRISTKCLAVLIQTMRVTRRHTDGNAVANTPTSIASRE